MDDAERRRTVLKLANDLDADHVAQHGTPAWYEARPTGIGASESPVLFGQSSYHSPASLRALKMGIADGDDEEDSWLLKLGHLAEPQAMAEYNAKNDAGGWATPFNVMLRSRRWPWLTATVDGLELLAHGDLGCVECKLTIFGQDDWLQDGERTIPDRVVIQAQHQMAVTGLQQCTVIAVIGASSKRPDWGVVHRDDAFIEGQLVPATEAFIRAVENEVPIGLAEIDGHDATSDLLYHIHPDDNGETITLEDDLWDDAVSLEAAKADKKAAEAAIKFHGNRLRAAIGDATYGQFRSGERYSLKSQTRSGYEVAETTFRVLRKMKD